jgi:hypothetical protein
MRKVIVTTVLMLAMSSFSLGGVTMTWVATDLGSGLTAYDFTVASDDGHTDYSFATNNLVFTADSGVSFNQSLVNNMVGVDKESDANTWNGMMGYSKALDTWYYNVTNPWGVISPSNVSVSGTSVLTLNNLGLGQAYTESALLIHIVADGNFSWTGGISRHGVTTDVSGQIPEPLTMSLLGVGGFGLILKRRKK